MSHYLDAALSFDPVQTGDFDALAELRDLAMRVTALRDSASNAFYRRHGFAQTRESEWDIEYERAAEPTV